MKINISVLFLLLTFGVSAQISVGPGKNAVNVSEEYKDSLKHFYETTTVFVYRDSDKDKLEEWTKRIKSVWTITDIEIISADEYQNNDFSGNYSFLTIVPLNESIKQDDGSWRYALHVEFRLWMNYGDNEVEMGVSELTIDRESNRMIWDHILNRDSVINVMYHYNSTTLYNWNPVYITNSMQVFQEGLKSEEFYREKRYLAEESLSNLSTDTLYVLDFSLYKRAGSGEVKGELDPEKIFKKYPHPYRVISPEQLSKLADSDKEKIYYLTFVYTPSRAYYNVMEAKSGKLAFAYHFKGTANFESRFAKNILKEI